MIIILLLLVLLLLLLLLLLSLLLLLYLHTTKESRFILNSSLSFVCNCAGKLPIILSTGNRSNATYTTKHLSLTSASLLPSLKFLHLRLFQKLFSFIVAFKIENCLVNVKLIKLFMWNLLDRLQWCF